MTPLMQELLDFKEKMDIIVENCFKSTDKFVTALKVVTYFLILLQSRMRRQSETN